MSETMNKLEISNVVLQEALEIVNLPYTAGCEQDEDFLALLIQGLNELGANEWHEVPDSVKLWYNFIAEQSAQDPEGDITIPPIELIEVEDVTVTEADTTLEPAEVVESEPTEAVAPKEKKAKKEPKPPKELKGTDHGSAATRAFNKERGVTAAERVRQMVLANADLTLDGLMEQLQKEDIMFKRSSASVVFNNAKLTIDMILKVGKVNNSKGETIITRA